MLDIILNAVNTVSSTIGWANERFQDLAEEEKELETKCLYSSLAKIAKADGSVTKESVNAVKKIFKRYNYTEEQQGMCILYFNEAKNNPLTIRNYAAELIKIVNKKCGEPDSILDEDEQMDEYIKCVEYLLSEMMNVFCEIAIADGQLSRNKRHLLDEVEELFINFYESKVFEIYDKESPLVISLPLVEITGESSKNIKEMYSKKRGKAMPAKMSKRLSQVLKFKFKVENVIRGLVEKCLKNQMNQDADF